MLKLKVAWHKIRLNYYKVILDDCIHHQVKNRIKSRIKHHRDKLNA